MYYKSRQPGLAKIITADWKSIPWETANEIYNEAADLAEGTAIVEYRQQVAEKYPDAKLDELQLPNKVAVRRKAGNKALVEVFIPRYKLDQFGIAIIAQIVAHIATLKIVTPSQEDILADKMLLETVVTLGDGCVHYTEDDFQKQYAVSGLEFVKMHFKTPYMMGLYRFLMLDTRGSYLTKQYKGDARNYSALVPLIMSAFKRYHNIPYCAWKRDELKWIVNPELCKAMLFDDMPEAVIREDGFLGAPGFTKDTLLQLRDQGLTWKSGPNVGTLRNALYTHTLYGMQGTVFDEVPDLAQVMLTQIWCAHPENRTKYMVLVPDAWDNIPVSLISPTMFITPVYSSTSEVMPWDA
jgi:hypothetical protein